MNCAQGYWGADCKSRCSEGCTDIGCDKVTGSCFECDSGYHGFWGSNCSNICPNNCESCDKSSGTCLFCPNGFWGSNCSKPCSTKNCKMCDINTGFCKSCESGFWGPDCNYRCNNCSNIKCDISTGACETCPDGFAGENCNIKCEISTCLIWQCDKKQGFVCSSCLNGFWGTLCGKRCMPNGNCNYCDKTTGICDSCVSGYWGTVCEKKCSESDTCEYCDRNTGICNSCLSGYWGNHCEHGCPKNCDGNCHKSTGRCSCKHGFWGDLCERKCLAGDRCQYCSKTYGTCSACKNGYWDSLCEKECPIVCTGQCDRYTGKCSYCRPGLRDVNCNRTCIEKNCETCKGTGDSYSCTKCRAGYWGQGCENQCSSERCLECHMTEGRCILCEDGFWGNSCNQKCQNSCQCCSLTYGTCSAPHYCLRIHDRYHATESLSQIDYTLIIVGVILIVCSLVVLSLALGLFCYIKRRSKKREGAATSEDQNFAKQSGSYTEESERQDTVEISSLQTRKVNRSYMVQETNKVFEEEVDHESVVETDDTYENP
ncbi:multiple epidermal growth factor-like domains protein 6 [Mercenaria mercenaria]|uniref:multiple epidermal growth factor-like domains protein 6 n=1 Tax=Mercenaria mercenaria TaxID=6596 RepID=UPI00234F6B66|nr:multiple epidermal growth factor-like domains protein 6 [Mercenaria mercenaria]